MNPLSEDFYMFQAVTEGG